MAENGSVTLGFPQASNLAKLNPVARPTPLPRRPKGRWFVGLLLLAAVSYGGYQVWETFFRYRAYGMVTGRVVQLSPPWEGVASYLHVREGETSARPRG
jgi:hypothetical protein